MTRLALITGGTTGIGAATCKALKAAGYYVAANYAANDEGAKKFKQETGIEIYKWDVTDYRQCEDGLENIAHDFGKPVEVLVNNAGITRDAMMHKMSIEDWNTVIMTDLTSCFYMSRAAITTMRQENYGRIINVSSVNGQLGQVGQTNYCAAKAGIIGFSKALARESISKGITVNVVAPGYTDTNMVKAVPENIVKLIVEKIPAARLATPEEIARAVVFLAADEASYITGETISVNGGYYMG